MKYYLHYKNDSIVGFSNCPITNGDFECREVSENEYVNFVKEFEDNIDKLQERQKLIDGIQERLNSLSQDIVQDMAGEIVPDIESRKMEFVSLHNQLRILSGKEPRNQK